MLNNAVGLSGVGTVGLVPRKVVNDRGVRLSPLVKDIVVVNKLPKVVDAAQVYFWNVEAAGQIALIVSGKCGIVQIPELSEVVVEILGISNKCFLNGRVLGIGVLR